MMSVATTTVVPLQVDRMLRRLAAATWAGAVTGFLVGGVGGRLAMRLLAVVNPNARGVTSDDGFEIGVVTVGGTAGLLALGAFAGVVGALAYVAIRRWLVGPPAIRSATCAVGAGVVVGSLLVHASGVDFTVLRPLWLTVGLFVVIPAAFGALIPTVMRRFEREESWFMRGPMPLVLIPLVVWAMPLFAMFIVAPTAVGILAWSRLRHWPPAARFVEGPVLATLVRVGCLGLFAVALFGLAGEIRALL